MPYLISDLLKQTQAVGALMPTVERHLSIERDLISILAPLLQHWGMQPCDLCQVLRFDQQTLVLGVTTTVAAARLRQLLPRMKIGLEQRGWKVSSICVRMQLQKIERKSKSCEKRTLSKIGFTAFSELFQRLAPSDLRIAVGHLLKHQDRDLLKNTEDKNDAGS